VYCVYVHGIQGWGYMYMGYWGERKGMGREGETKQNTAQLAGERTKQSDTYNTVTAVVLYTYAQLYTIYRVPMAYYL
jgi:hypothetical protein